MVRVRIPLTEALVAVHLGEVQDFCARPMRSKTVVPNPAFSTTEVPWFESGQDDAVSRNKLNGFPTGADLIAASASLR
jgi:hypothetical protein